MEGLGGGWGNYTRPHKYALQQRSSVVKAAVVKYVWAPNRKETRDLRQRRTGSYINCNYCTKSLCCSFGSGPL